ncbi:MAG: malate dehydrogenase [Armatimonadetes bacterium]|nr:malate dehydrogenase [Armatimonadota bacterium]
MYLTNEKVAVLGAAGAIGSNLVQTLLETRTTNRIVMYDPLAGPLEGAAEEIYHCAFPDAQVTSTLDEPEALRGATCVITAGGAPRKEGMTREDLRRGNCEIARDLGEKIKRYCPDCKFLIVIFNPADITGLTALVHSGLDPRRVTTLAALDSTRLQTRLAQHFDVPQDQVTGCATYGGHGEKMAVFKGDLRVAGTPLTDILAGAQVNGKGLTRVEWQEIQEHVRNGGARIIKLRGRSSFQSPSSQSVQMLRARITAGDYPWPCGAYYNEGEFRRIMMAAPVRFTPEGIVAGVPRGDEEDMAALRASYVHLCQLRDQTIADGLLPPIAEWGEVNPHL